MMTQEQMKKLMASPAIRSRALTRAQIVAAAQWARQNLLNGLCAQKKTFTIGWGAAFVQFGRVHVVQRAEMRS